MTRVGSATLPLHGGKAPRWLFDRVTQLAPEIVEAIVLEHGRSAFLQRLSGGKGEGVTRRSPS